MAHGIICILAAAALLNPFAEETALKTVEKTENLTKKVLTGDMFDKFGLPDEDDPYIYEIASYSTKYAGSFSNNRNYNMLLAVDTLNGIIINPGEEFSYLWAINNMAPEGRYYKEAGVISDGELISGLGGGICQVSSTLYNSALYSDMTITERRNHSQKIDYLPPGRDATVAAGSIDLRFRNDLKIPVMITGIMADGVITMGIVSQRDPEIGDIDIDVTYAKGVYTLHRYVDGVEDYTARSIY